MGLNLKGTTAKALAVKEERTKLESSPESSFQIDNENSMSIVFGSWHEFPQDYVSKTSNRMKKVRDQLFWPNTCCSKTSFNFHVNVVYSFKASIPGHLPSPIPGIISRHFLFLVLTEWRKKSAGFLRSPLMAMSVHWPKASFLHLVGKLFQSCTFANCKFQRWHTKEEKMKFSETLEQ